MVAGGAREIAHSEGIKLDFQSGDAGAGKVAQLIKALAAI